jgi:hypothetical protein
LGDASFASYLTATSSPSSPEFFGINMVAASPSMRFYVSSPLNNAREM